MAVQITDAMLITVGGGAFNTIENVGKVRRTLVAAGVPDIELHPLEIANVLHYREQARQALMAVDRLLASGPLPAEHLCELHVSSRLVKVHNGCRFGCAPGKPRIEIER